MKVYGALESAQIEWFTNAGKPAASSYPYRVIYVTDLKQIQVSDGTNWNPSAIRTYTAGTLPAAGASNQYQLAFITDTLQVKVSDGSQWKTIGARLDTYTSGTIPAAASNTNSIIWVSDLQQVQVSNGTSWVQVGSKAGTKNYFSQNNANSDFETNSVSPWSACTLTFSSGVPSGAPTLTATQMAIATTATNPLSGTYSMQLTKSAANAQYQGYISGSLTIDREDTAKVLYGSFYYEVVSGTIDMSGSSTQDLEIWIYNTVSGVWTQPAGYRGMNQSSGVGKVVFSFQTDGTYANNAYKIAVITQQTGTSAYVVKFDDFVVGPQAIVLGTAMTDWQSYTPTFTGLGTPTSVGFTWRRVGDSVEIQGKFTVGTSTATEARISLPSGLTVSDTTKIPSLSKVGSFTASYIEAFAGEVLTEPSVTYITLGKQGAGTPGLQKLNGNSVLATSGQICSLFAKIPISGWSSTTQISSDSDSRLLYLQYTGNGGQGITANVTNITFSTLVTDSHSSWSGTAFSCPVSGWYNINGCCSMTTSNTSDYFAYVNGSSKIKLSASGITGATKSFNGGIYLNAGDSLTIRSDTSMTLANSAINHWISISKSQGTSVIAATETVAASYYISAASLAVNTSQINFDGKNFDSHNAVTTGASWKFTAPISGTFEVTCHLLHSAGANTQVNIHKNGTVFASMIYLDPTVYENAGSLLIKLNAGDYIDLRNTSSYTFVGTTLSTQRGYINITRVGN